MKKFENMKKVLLLSLVLLVGFTSCSDDDDPVVPDYETYTFENSLTGVDVEIMNSNGYSFTVVLNRSTSNQQDDISLELVDASGKFGFDNGLTTKTVTFDTNSSSKVIVVEPMDASTISIFDVEYDLTVRMVVPAGTPSQSGFSVDVTAMPLVSWESQGNANIDYGWVVAGPVYGVTSNTFELFKDSNVAYYNCKDAYGTGFDILFAIDNNGEVLIEDGQAMYMFAGSLIGLNNDFQMNMVVNSAVYDATAKTVTINYDQVRDDEQPIFKGVPFDNITDVITLP